jgi:hypothetical protein
MSMVTSPSEQHKTFFNPETETDPDRKPTFAQKTEPDPNRSQKVKPAGLYQILYYMYTYITIHLMYFSITLQRNHPVTNSTIRTLCTIGFCSQVSRLATMSKVAASGDPYSPCKVCHPCSNRQKERKKKKRGNICWKTEHSTLFNERRI